MVFCFSPFFARFCPFFGCFSVFFMSSEPICIIVNHHKRVFSPSLASFLHICFGDIGNLDMFIRSPPRCGVAMHEVH